MAKGEQELTAVFPKIEEFLARRTKKRLRILYFTLLALYVSALVFMIVFALVRVNTLQDRSWLTPFTVVSILLSIAFGWFSLVFFSIKFRLTKKYVKMFDDFQTGIKEAEACTFVSYDPTVRVKDDVEFYVMNVKTPAKSRLYENIDREVLVYKQSPMLDIRAGQKMKIITHSSILVAFEIIGE